MKKAPAAAVVVLLVAVAAWWLWPDSHDRDIASRAKQPPTVYAHALSAALIPNEDLPPEGSRSLFDHLVAQNGQLPYPFAKVVELIAKNDPQGNPPLTLMIPHGRSLLKAQADDGRPRVLAAADFQATNTAASYGLSPRGALFVGYVENANEIEVLSYNEVAGRFEFQLVQNYCEGCIPKLVYAKRAICTTCHQGATPIFPQRPWNETNGQPETATKIVEARGDAPYLGVPARNLLGVPERFEQLTDIGQFAVVTQASWIDGCGDAGSTASGITTRPAMNGRAGAGNGEQGRARDGQNELAAVAGTVCRRQMLKLALEYLWNPTSFDPTSADAQRLRELQAASWPQDGIVVPENSLHNRDPLGETRGFKGTIHALFTRTVKPGEGAKNNEDLEAFDRLPKLPAALDPLTPRPPRRVLRATDIDGAYGLAAMLTDSDYKQIESAAKFDLPTLLAAVDHVDPKLYEAAVFSRVTMMNALLAALGSKPLGYCCLSTAEMSAPVASGEPPVVLSAGSPVEHFQQYCFACHRGNPSKKLNFMAGATEAEVLDHIKAKTEIRDALDWSRYAGTDKAAKLMPPAESAQRRQLEAAVAQDPTLLDGMHSVVPGMFDF